MHEPWEPTKFTTSQSKILSSYVHICTYCYYFYSITIIAIKIVIITYEIASTFILLNMKADWLFQITFIIL